MDPDEAAAMAQVSMRMRRRFPQCRPEEIERALATAHHEYDGRPIRHFVPILVERSATDALLAAGRTAQPPRSTTEAPSRSATADVTG
jgi:hypothetical protein